MTTPPEDLTLVSTDDLITELRTRSDASLIYLGRRLDDESIAIRESVNGQAKELLKLVADVIRGFLQNVCSEDNRDEALETVIRIAFGRIGKRLDGDTAERAWK